MRSLHLKSIQQEKESSYLVIENHILSLNLKILKIWHLRKLIWIMFVALIIIPLQSIVFAESSYDINIPSGSADKVG
ncbi:MAG: hypothetical protein OEY10_04870 [Nitrosopumilus sp.]|nr:hypothetical protein [Nitrosopumilus sp.]